ncbi:YheC/YheD family protein [Heyndrickxia sp. NPDC080065]|uniref:YheC/YheD family endospore coat-associated protein n=1 Tax=Heyndrickxia sp. NPDC080065 TaxID=3390568 RepID=UPI003D053110
MNIIFDKKRMTFVHNEISQSPIFWGATDELLPYSPENSKNQIGRIVVKKTDCRVGPLVGILTSRTKDGDIVGSKELFISIQKELQISGGLSYVYTLEDCKNDFINGAFYIEEDDVWIKSNFPYPNIIYNRISSRIEEKNDQFFQHKISASNNGIFFFNPAFIDKFSMFRLFSKNSLLRPLLPPTRMIKEQQELEEFLSQYKNIYLKPTIRSQGNGIFYIKKEGNGPYFCQKAKQKKEFYSFYDLWNYIEKSILKYPYIAQKDIDSAKIDDKKYDYRILSHFTHNEYIITGIGIRVADSDRITTHVTKGGYILPYNEIRQQSLEKVFQWILKECGETLSNEYGTFAEFTIDLGRDHSGKLWIFEVNAKPMTFDENEIEKSRIQTLVNIFYEQSIFNNN